MTEAELMQHFWSALENAISFTMMYISVFTGYLIMAYLVGARLTSPQCSIATGAFIVFSGWCVWGSTALWNAGWVVAIELRETRPELTPIDVNPALVVFVVLMIGIVGALKFMWDIRHPKTE
jgi:hypothetical protein